MEEQEIKDLTINGKCYAKYVLSGNHIFIKTIIYLIEEEENKSEDYLIGLISLIEQKEIQIASYLNV